MIVDKMTVDKIAVDKMTRQTYFQQNDCRQT